MSQAYFSFDKQFIEMYSRIHNIINGLYISFTLVIYSSIIIFTEAKAVVVGPPDIYVKMGSEVILTCIVSQGPHELGTIYWYRGKKKNFLTSLKNRENNYCKKKMLKKSQKKLPC